MHVIFEQSPTRPGRALLLFCFAPPALTYQLSGAGPCPSSTWGWSQQGEGQFTTVVAVLFIPGSALSSPARERWKDEKFNKDWKILRSSACWGTVIKNLCKFVAWCSAKSDFIKKSVQVHLDRTWWLRRGGIFFPSDTVSGGCFGSSIYR